MTLTKNKKVIFFLVILICALCYLIGLLAPVTPPPITPVAVPVGPTPLQRNPLLARVECKQYVRNELRVPLSAKFSSVMDYTINGQPANYHAVTGIVEAQNAFGVVLESQFRCDLHYLPDKPEVWILDEFRLE